MSDAPIRTVPEIRETINVFWFRRDLRVHDNHGLWQALRAGRPVMPLFIFDTDILNKLEDKNDRRLSFIYDLLKALNDRFIAEGSGLCTLFGKPVDVFAALGSRIDIDTVFANEDYEPYARQRDEGVQKTLGAKGTRLLLFSDQLVCPPGEVLKPDGKPYTVFTPFSRKWKEVVGAAPQPYYPSEEALRMLLRVRDLPFLTLAELGFHQSHYDVAPPIPDLRIIHNYADTRNLPGIRGTTRLGPHLRFGSVSARQMVALARETSDAWLNELIWREFFMHILWHFPQVERRAFRPEYDRIAWRNDMESFERWKNGTTGFPIVDAGMRELEATGFMHNRVRMITASFLVKHLLIDWRLGEHWFARKLMDFELSSNNGNWQWAAGTGCDAAPYFRIFNPWTQQRKFDPEEHYIRHWLPEYQGPAYPAPIVDHAGARERCLSVYKAALRP